MKKLRNILESIGVAILTLFVVGVLIGLIILIGIPILTILSLVIVFIAYLLFGLFGHCANIIVGIALVLAIIGYLARQYYKDNF